MRSSLSLEPPKLSSSASRLPPIIRPRSNVMRMPAAPPRPAASKADRRTRSATASLSEIHTPRPIAPPSSNPSSGPVISPGECPMRRLTVHFGNEPIAMLRHGLNETRPRRIVAELPTQRLDALRERLVRDRHSAPDFVEEAFLRDQAAMFADEQGKCVEIPAIQLDCLIVAPQLAVADIKREAIEAESSGRDVFRNSSALAHTLTCQCGIVGAPEHAWRHDNGKQSRSRQHGRAAVAFVTAAAGLTDQLDVSHVVEFVGTNIFARVFLASA